MSRITAGVAKGVHLQVLGGVTRPLTDRIKISLFDTLNPVIKNAKVLDLYSGSGAFGLEALSRGADSAVLVEKDQKAINLIKKNSVATKLNYKTEIILAKTEDYLARNQYKFTLIFLDPPFSLPRETKLSSLKNASHYLTTEGILLLRYPKTEKYPASVKIKDRTLSIILQKDYGVSRVNFYQFNVSL